MPHHLEGESWPATPSSRRPVVYRVDRPIEEQKKEQAILRAIENKESLKFAGVCMWANLSPKEAKPLLDDMVGRGVLVLIEERYWIEAT